MHQVCEGKVPFSIEYKSTKPYFKVHSFYAKGRHVGQSLLNMFTSEFKTHTRQYYIQAIETSAILINDTSVSVDYVISNGDMISHRMHHHEVPILPGKVYILYVDSNIIAVDKPGGLCVHPNGSFDRNTLLWILENHFSCGLIPLYRLDKLTSGVVIFAKSAVICNNLRNNIHEKVYFAKVKGIFPSDPKENENSHLLYNEESKSWFIKERIGLDPLRTGRNQFVVVPNGGKDACTEVTLVSSDGLNSIVQCKLHSGRTHQIRVHLQYIGFPILNDPCYGGILTNENSFKIGNEELVSVRYGNDCKNCNFSDWIIKKDYDKPICSFIFLHAFRYSLNDNLTFETVPPSWMKLK